jgi:hypothetical protein
VGAQARALPSKERRAKEIRREPGLHESEGRYRSLVEAARASAETGALRVVDAELERVVLGIRRERRDAPVTGRQREQQPRQAPDDGDGGERPRVARDPEGDER